MSKFVGSVLVTGGTTGIGFEAALQIARQQTEVEVVVASRSDKDNVAQTINTKLKQSNVSYRKLDLGSFAQIRSFVEDWGKADHGPIKALVMNAGLQYHSSKPRYTTDGIEQTFGVNHVGHALLFYLLRPYLAPDARIVITASGAHDPAQKTGLPTPEYPGGEKLAFPDPHDKPWPGTKRYSTSKLTNVLFTYAIETRLSQARAAGRTSQTVTAFDPGLVAGTQLLRELPSVISNFLVFIGPRITWLLKLIAGPNVHTAEESGLALARLAVGDDVAGTTGKYFEGLKEIKSSELSYNKANQEELWNWTVQYVSREGERTEFEKF